MLLTKIIFYGSYLAFFSLIFFIFLLWKNFSFKKKSSIFLIILIFLNILFIYSRFVEPQILVVKNVKIETWFTSKFALVSDLHLWVYKNEKFVEKIVKKINSQDDLDGVLIPGDFYFEDYNLDYEKKLKSFSELKFRTFAVLWNHDTENPWPKIRDLLKKWLEKNNVTLLNNEVSKVWDINILWLWDKWALEDDISLIDKFKKEDNLIVLAHNPDTVMFYQNDIADLTVSWHTHGWQIRIPFIYKNVIPSDYGFDSWFYNINNNKLYITSGAGEVWLPMRLFIPPEIVIIETY